MEPVSPIDQMSDAGLSGFAATLAAPRPVFAALRAHVTELVTSFRAHPVELTVETNQDALADYQDLIAWSALPPLDDDDPLRDQPVVLGQVAVSMVNEPDRAFRDLYAAVRVCLELPKIRRWDWTTESTFTHHSDIGPDGEPVLELHPAGIELGPDGDPDPELTKGGASQDAPDYDPGQTGAVRLAPLEILAHHDPADLVWWVLRRTRTSEEDAEPVTWEESFYASARGAHISDVLDAMDAFPIETAMVEDLSVELTRPADGRRVLVTLIDRSGDLPTGD